VKGHGTCAGLSMFNDVIYCQSKKNVITVKKDNAGFAAFVEKRMNIIEDAFNEIKHLNPEIDFNENIVTIMGEFVGCGIQKGVAVSQLDKKMLIFGIKVKPIDDEIPSYWIEHDIFHHKTLNEFGIYNIKQFGEFELDIDFNDPLLYYNKMIKMMEGVEKECPIGKYFGVSDLGEGIVFKTSFKGNDFQFKIKGILHVGKSKIKVQKKVDDVKLQKIIDVVDQVTPQWRLVQIFDEVFDVLNGGEGDIKGTGDFLRALISDVWKEETDIIIENDLTSKDVNARISKVGRNYFMNRLDEDVGL